MPLALQATLAEGKVSKQLRYLALPLMWGLMATMSLNAIETFYIAQLGREILAAFSFTFPVMMVLTSLAIGLGAGTSSAVSRAIGEGDAHRARRLATDAMLLTFLISLLVCVLGWLWLDPLFRLLGAEEALLPHIRSYMSIWYLSAPLLMIPMVSLSALRAMGMSHIQGYLMTSSALFNVFLSPLLIFGGMGVPALGLEGAAWATLITRFLMLIITLYILHWRVHLLISPFDHWHKIKESWKTIFAVGVPAMVTNVIIPLASGVMISLVAVYGNDAVAGLGVAMRVEPLTLIVFYALSGVIGPFFGQNLGAKKWDRLAEAIRVLTRFSLIWGLLLALILWLLGEEVVTLFGNHKEVVAIAVVYFTIVPISYGAYGMVMSINAAFNGLGRPWPAMLLSGSRVIFVFLPIAYICQWAWGIYGIFIATALTNLFVGFWARGWILRHIKQLTNN